MRSRLPLVLRSALVALAAFFPLACDDADAPRDGLSFDVTAEGPYAVGFRSAEITYPAADGSGDRTIPVALWYPVEPRAAAALEEPQLARYFIYRSTRAIVDAPPARPAFEGGYPVLAHSHGHGGFPEQSFPTFEWLAANGILVVAPGHVGNQLGDVAQPDYRNTYDIDATRTHDVRAALDHLESLAADDPLHGLPNTSRVVVSGHSRGTTTVWGLLGAPVSLDYLDASCAAGDYDAIGGCPAAQRAVYAAGLGDPRIVAGIPMAGSGRPDLYGGYAGMNTVLASVLQMTGGDDPVGADLVFANVLATPMIWVDYAGGCHELFGTPRSCGDDVDDEDARRTLGTYVTAFVRAQLFSDEDPTVRAVLDGTHVVSSRIEYHGR